MSFLDALIGRSKTPPANLDQLFGLPSAAVNLEVQADLVPTGQATVCFKPASGAGFATTQKDVRELVQLTLTDSGRPSGTVREEDDQYGYHWIVVEDPDLENLVGATHLISSTLTEHGYGPQLLCAAVGFAPTRGAAGVGASKVALVYLYKRGSFYPFAPLVGQQRNNELELRVRGLLRSELRMEEDLTRWFALWGAPIL